MTVMTARYDAYRSSQRSAEGTTSSVSSPTSATSVGAGGGGGVPVRLRGAGEGAVVVGSGGWGRDGVGDAAGERMAVRTDESPTDGDGSGL